MAKVCTKATLLQKTNKRGQLYLKEKYEKLKYEVK
jgi:hypothetical protein